ncbi:hypothetical protein U9M48_020011 [Paspalum notatum var. saurae]|uniref:Transposase n=1 Tax=Paspalum notatum var. saurae TaxID=547442 RepID=A0AAQ3WS59_PASNO
MPQLTSLLASGDYKLAMHRYDELTDKVVLREVNRPRLEPSYNDLVTERRNSASNPTADSPAMSNSSGSRGVLRQALADLDLNSQVPNVDNGMTFSQLLRSGSAATIGDAQAAVVYAGVDPLCAGLAGHVTNRGRAGGAGHAAAQYRHPKRLGTGGGGRRTAHGGGVAASSGDIGVAEGDHVDDGDENSKEELYYDKAEWKNSTNNAVFCELCVEEIRAGNAPSGHMSARAYKNISDKFYARLGLRHSKLQLKNRWDALKGLYTFWLWANKQTAIGRSPNGGIVASEKWWKDHTKRHGEWKKLKNGPPECLEDLEVMFQHLAVDGSSSCVPGEVIEEEQIDDLGDDTLNESPISQCATGPRKRTGSKIANSPRKRIKSPMVKIMNTISETMQANSAVTQSVLKGEHRAESIKECMKLVVECGAEEGSVEHFMATQLLIVYPLKEDEEGKAITKVALTELETMQEVGAMTCMFGMYYDSTFMNKTKKRKTGLSRHDWVMSTLENPSACFDMFRMRREVFLRLHDLLVLSYGLKSTKKMNSMESLAMFFWMIGAPQSMRQAENRFERSKETISRKFDEVLQSIYKLSVDIVKPKDPEFKEVHLRLKSSRFSPYFDNCIGAIDGTHVPVIVPASKVLQHVGRHGYTTQNVLAICDFDMRFTFAVAGWPGSAHDMRVFNDAIRKYGDKFPHPPPGKFYLVDSGYPNRPGYLALYRGTKYHIPEYRQGSGPSGKKEVFNYLHSSLRNVIERSFGVLKMKWRILLKLPSYPMRKQSKIILACMAVHNFIRESALSDEDFERCDLDENYMPMPTSCSRTQLVDEEVRGEEDQDMNAFRVNIANALFYRRRACLQPTIALSTIEADFIALCDTCKEAIWLKGFYIEFSGDTSCIKLFCDSQSAIHLTKDQMFYERTKHIDVKYHYVREVIVEGRLNMQD